MYVLGVMSGRQAPSLLRIGVTTPAEKTGLAGRAGFGSMWMDGSAISICIASALTEAQN